MFDVPKEPPSFGASPSMSAKDLPSERATARALRLTIARMSEAQPAEDGLELIRAARIREEYQLLDSCIKQLLHVYCVCSVRAAAAKLLSGEFCCTAPAFPWCHRRSEGCPEGQRLRRRL